MRPIAAPAAILLAAILAGPASADITTKQFLQLYYSPDGQDIGALRIGAMEQGMHATNAYVSQSYGGKAIYCQPDTLVLTASQLADMVKRATEKDSKLEDQPLASSLLGVLRATFPCSASK